MGGCVILNRNCIKERNVIIVFKIKELKLVYLNVKWVDFVKNLEW